MCGQSEYVPACTFCELVHDAADVCNSLRASVGFCRSTCERMRRHGTGSEANGMAHGHQAPLADDHGSNNIIISISKNEQLCPARDAVSATRVWNRSVYE